MACASNKKGRCKAFHDAPCPVLLTVQDMFGDMKYCKPIAEKLGVNQYTGEKTQ